MALTKRTKKHQKLRRYATFLIADVVPKIGKASVLFGDKKVRLRSEKYKVFFHKGTDCWGCGMKGRFFALENLPGIKSYHMNLYGIDVDGDEVLMTIDHIYPKSKGGSSRLENFQPLCKVCNERKADRKARNIMRSRFFSPTEDEYEDIVDTLSEQHEQDVSDRISKDDISVSYASRDRMTNAFVVIQNLLYMGIAKSKRLALITAMKRKPYNF